LRRPKGPFGTVVDPVGRVFPIAVGRICAPEGAARVDGVQRTEHKRQNDGAGEMGDFMAALSEKSRQPVETIRHKRESPFEFQKRRQLSSRAQRNGFRRRDVRSTIQIVARRNQSLRHSPNSNRFAEMSAMIHSRPTNLP